MAFVSVRPICNLVKFLRDHVGISQNFYQKLLNKIGLLTVLKEKTPLNREFGEL